MDIKEEIKSLKAHIALLEKQLADEKKQEESKFERVAEDEPYYFIFLCEKFMVEEEREEYEPFDDDAFALNNYFYSRERAEEVYKKIKMLLKLERLHDTFCPDYVPNWDCNNDEKKHYVYYSNIEELYKFDSVYVCQRNDVYFSSEEIAQKVCDIFNAEKENEND